MRIYALYHEKYGLHLCIGEGCVAAAEFLCKQFASETEEWSVSGSWEVTEGTLINLGSFWPYFTNNPPKELLYCKEF